MSEEIKRQEGELNEQALENVSGGDGNPALIASRVCAPCDRKGGCSHCTHDLVRYMNKHPDESITSCPRCPFYNEGR